MKRYAIPDNLVRLRLLNDMLTDGIIIAFIVTLDRTEVRI